MGEVAHDGVQGGLKRFGDRAFDLGGGALARGAEQQRVGGGGVAIDGDGVEGGIDVARQHALQGGGGDFGVGEDIDQHGGHIGGDHAGAFGDACDVDRAAVALHGGGGPFGEGVGGHHRVGGHFDGIFAQGGGQGRDFGDDFVMRQAVRR